MAKEFINGLMAVAMMELGTKIKCMEAVSTNAKKVSILDSTSMIKSMVKVSFYGKMDEHTKDSGKMAISMELVCTQLSQMIHQNKENGMMEKGLDGSNKYD